MCLVSLIAKLQLHKAKLSKLKGEMGKSRIIRGNFNTFLSVTAHIRKLNIIKDVSSSQINVNSVCCPANYDSFFLELDEVVHKRI